MALKATIFRATLSISDMDRGYYETHNLTIARHPSENDERMMLRILAFALYAHERLSFTKGLSTDDEPELWQIGFDSSIEHWIELGLPTEKRIRQACNKAERVSLLTYGGRSIDPWWAKIKNQLSRFENLTILQISDPDSIALQKLVKRSMDLHFFIQDGEISISDQNTSLTVRPSPMLD